MNQSERRQLLIRSLLKEHPRYRSITIPRNVDEQKTLLRSLMNVRMAAPISEEFQKVQDEYLKETNRERGVVELSELAPVQDGIYLWRGDIQAKFSELVGTSRSTVSIWEAEIKNHHPSLEKYERMKELAGQKGIDINDT